jgi:hypothetical protein
MSYLTSNVRKHAEEAYLVESQQQVHLYRQKGTTAWQEIQQQAAETPHRGDGWAGGLGLC